MGNPNRHITLVLASASPRRRELLASLGLEFEIRSADLDESVEAGEPPELYVARLSRQKALAVRDAHGLDGALVLAADTTVVLGQQILGKPADEEDARRMLRALSGQSHRVLTSVTAQGPGGAAPLTRVVETAVTFEPLSDAQVAWYVSTGEPLDKAGAYAIQGKGGAFVRRIEGSYSNVVGLPLAETVKLLGDAGHPFPWTPGGAP